MPSVGTLGIINILNGITPCEGPRCLPFIADFSLGNKYDFDLTAPIQNGQLDNVQTLYIDNSANANTLTITIGGSQQTIVVPKNSCGYYTALLTSMPVFSATTAGTVKVYFGILNFYIPPTVWGV